MSSGRMAGIWCSGHDRANRQQRIGANGLQVARASLLRVGAGGWQAVEQPGKRLNGCAAASVLRLKFSA